MDQYVQKIKIYESEDEILADLIETNIRQRGIGNPNPVKLGRCIKELERIYGFREGRPEKLSNNFTVNNQPTNESELAEQLGMTRQTLQNYKKLTEMIPELEKLHDTSNRKNQVKINFVIALRYFERIEFKIKRKSFYLDKFHDQPGWV